MNMITTKTDMVDVLISQMQVGIAEFEFLKKNGKVRHAFGTTLLELVAQHVMNTEGGPVGVVCFWDVEKADWRSLRPSSLLWVKIMKQK